MYLEPTLTSFIFVYSGQVFPGDYPEYKRAAGMRDSTQSHQLERPDKYWQVFNDFSQELMC